MLISKAPALEAGLNCIQIKVGYRKISRVRLNTEPLRTKQQIVKWFTFEPCTVRILRKRSLSPVLLV